MSNITKGEIIRTIILETPWMTRKEIAAQAGCTVARVGEIVRAMSINGSIIENEALKRLADHQRLVAAGRAHDVIAC